MLTLRGPQGVRRGAALRELGIINDGAVLIRNGIIAEVGSTRRLENLKEARAAIEIPADGRIITPGFVDANLSLQVHSPEGSDDKHFRRRKSIVEFQEATLSLLRSCLQHGTLTADVKAFGGELHRDLDVPAFRKLADIGSNPISIVRTWHVGNTGEPQSHKLLIEALAAMDRKRLIDFVEFNGEPGHSVDLELMSALVKSETGIKMTWRGGSAHELARSVEQFRPTAIYCAVPTYLTALEVGALARGSSIVVLGAGKEVFEGHASTIGRGMADAGAAIALSSGYDSSSAASYSMQMSLALAVVRLGLTAAEAFVAATVNAAYAAGRGDVVGSIEVGKKADLLLLNASHYREIPEQFGVNHVDMAIRDGNVVLNRTRWRALAS